MRRRYLVSGRVQGVGFRWFVSREAQRLGLHGRVSNLPDGTVEVLANGPAQALAELEEGLRQGPRWARVDRVDNSDISDDVIVPTGFHIVG